MVNKKLNMKLGNFNIRCNNNEECNDIQLLLFSLDYRWINSSDRVLELSDFPVYLSLAQIKKRSFVWTNTDYGLDYTLASALLRKIKLERMNKKLKK